MIASVVCSHFLLLHQCIYEFVSVQLGFLSSCFCNVYIYVPQAKVERFKYDSDVCSCMNFTHCFVGLALQSLKKNNNNNNLTFDIIKNCFLLFYVN